MTGRLSYSYIFLASKCIYDLYSLLFIYLVLHVISVEMSAAIFMVTVIVTVTMKIV